MGILLLLGIARLGAARRDLTFARSDLGTARQELVRRNDRAAGDALETATQRLGTARGHARSFPLGLVRPLPLLGSPSRTVDGAARAGLETVAAGRVILDASASFPTSGANALKGADLSAFHAAAQRSLQAAEEARGHLDQARRVLEGPSGAALPPLSGPPKAMRRELERTTRQLDGAGRGLSLLADLTDPRTEARLLVVAQDSLELRPTGGFIGSFGVLHFSRGTVRLERYEDAQDLPSPSPPMEPPDDLGPALARPWSLTNANWWPDFPTSAATAREMFRRQQGGEVDGVIGLTEYATARMIGAVGPLQVPGYSKPVVEEGFDQRVLYEVEDKRPLDNPRKKFLTELSNVLFDRVFNLPADRLPRLSEALDRSAGAGDIQVWFADPARQRQVEPTVVAGRLPPAGQDFLMLVDANLTASKANLGLVKEASYRVFRQGDGRLRARLELSVRNDADQSPSNPFYNGFLRVYVPLESELLFDKVDQTDDGPAPDGPYQVFGHRLDVQPRQREDVTFEYVLPRSVEADKRYRLTWVRQAGTPRDSLTAHIDGRTLPVPNSDGRSLHSAATLRDHPVIEFLKRRWIVRKLGLD